MDVRNALALRFQRAELREKANLSPAGLACLNTAPGPHELVAALSEQGDARDAVFALAQILPHRQAVWWACLGVRLLPGLAARPADAAAVDVAETWVQTSAAADAARAGVAADHCHPGEAAGWTAMAAYWSGLTIAPPEQQAVVPAPHLPGVATRTALLLTAGDPALRGKIGFADLLGIGLELMRGDLGRKAQTILRERLAGGG